MTTELIKMLLLDLLARVDRKEPEVSYITKPLSVLDAFRFYGCSGYLSHWFDAADEMGWEGLAWVERTNGMTYLRFSPEAPRRDGERSQEDTQGIPAIPRTLKQIQCELGAKQMDKLAYERAIQAAEKFPRTADSDTENSMHRSTTIDEMVACVERNEKRS